MANQLALRLLTRPGDEVIVGRESHAVWHETGGGRGERGRAVRRDRHRRAFTADELIAAIKPRDHLIFPPTTLVEVENTHNRAGGVVWPRRLRRIGAAARECGIASFLDGARL